MIIDFQYKDTSDGAIVMIDAATLDIGKTWINLETVVEEMEVTNDDIVWISHLNYTFRFFEPILLKRGWKNKYCQDKGNGWHPYCAKLKPLNYTLQLWGEERSCSAFKYTNKNGKTIRVLNASKWIRGAELGLYKLNENDAAFLSGLNPLKNTPAATAKAKIGKLERNKSFDLSIFYSLKTAIEGGLIDLYVPKGSYYKTAYHYDITSLYPSILCSIDFFPAIEFATYTTAAEKADHKHNAYWIWTNDRYLCDVESEIIPEGSIKMPLYMRNNVKQNVLALFEQKQSLTKGTVAYNEIKIELNGFIGTLIQRDYINDFYPYVNNDKDIILTSTKKSFKQLYEVYEYIIALARKRIKTELRKAREQGAEVLQVNTDGFFTDKPIQYDAEKSLGSLRFEYEAHNLILYACNQYVCDEEICIAGLPAEYYEPNKIDFEYRIMTYDKRQKAVIFGTKKMTLGEEVIYER